MDEHFFEGIAMRMRMSALLANDVVFRNVVRYGLSGIATCKL